MAQRSAEESTRTLTEEERQMAESAGETLVAVVGIDHGEHRAEPGDVVDWLPEKTAKRLLREGALEKQAEKPAPEATESAETAEPTEQAPEDGQAADEAQTGAEGGEPNELPTR